jgi:hypothetical protein
LQIRNFARQIGSIQIVYVRSQDGSCSCIVCLPPLDSCTVAFLARQIFDPIRGCPVTVGMNVPNRL